MNKIKHCLLLICILWFTGNRLAAQDSTLKKSWYVKASLLTGNSSEKVKGYLVSINDSTVFILKKLPYRNGDSTFAKLRTALSYQSLEQVRVIRKGKFEKSVLYGAILGTVAGAVLGYNTKDQKCASNVLCINFSPGVNAIFGAVTGVSAGTLVGLLVGVLGHKNYKIGGNLSTYKKMKTELAR